MGLVNARSPGQSTRPAKGIATGEDNCKLTSIHVYHNPVGDVKANDPTTAGAGT